MPQIIVMADKRPDTHRRAVMFTERVTARDFESEHFQTQLVERLGWAVGDAHVVEDRAAVAEDDGEKESDRPAGSEKGAQRRSARVLTTAS
jgi:hypothetical protein